MRRWEFIWLFGASLTWSVAATAQQAARTYRLGVLLPHPRDVPVNVAFVEEFRRHGFVEGHNLDIEWRAYGPHFDRISRYAAELAKARVDVIVTGGEEAIRAAQQATNTIPIVALDDMLGSGYVKSLARPEGNTTGVSVLAVDLDGKRQDLLIEAVPGLRRLATLADIHNAAANPPVPITTRPTISHRRAGHQSVGRGCRIDAAIALLPPLDRPAGMVTLMLAVTPT
jgi:putative tryptophan/tyrosine transport system substrate-binding protein